MGLCENEYRYQVYVERIVKQSIACEILLIAVANYCKDVPSLIVHQMHLYTLYKYLQKKCFDERTYIIIARGYETYATAVIFIVIDNNYALYR